MFQKLTIILGIFTSVMIGASPAFAVTVSDIAENMIAASSDLPALLAGLAYALGILFGVIGILKLIEHVQNPTQTPLKIALIHFLIGGALFALPVVYEAMINTINGGEITDFDLDPFSFGDILSGALGELGGGLFGIELPNLNGIMAAIIAGLESVPALIAAMSYLLGLVLGIAGLLKLKGYVENPDQNPLREAVIRFIIGGAMFALPTVFESMLTLVSGGDDVGLWGEVMSVLGTLGWVSSTYTGGSLFTGDVCNPFGLSMGSAICSVILHAGAAPAFLSSLSYLFGLILGVWGLLKVRDHVLNPTQTQVWEGFSRLLAGGGFFALPFVVESVRATVTPETLSGFGIFGSIFGVGTITGYNETLESSVCSAPDLGGIGGAILGGLSGGGSAASTTTSGGLDTMLACMMADLIGPIHSVLNFFTFTAGIILIMIGISRLIKTAQDGARGPGGIGTFMTFIAGGSLISYNEFIRAFTTSLFNNPVTLTHATLKYTDQMSDASAGHVHTTMSAILKFMIVVGLISFVRGIFIVRSVAEGNGQASLMAGITHMVGGALAVNLGPLLQAVQTTLGITQYGIAFS